MGLELGTIPGGVSPLYGMFDELLHQSEAPPLCVRDLAWGLRSLCPGQSLFFASLVTGDEAHTAAVDGAGWPAPGLAAEVQRALAVLGKPEAGKRAGCFPLPPGTGLAGQVLVFHEILDGEDHQGWLGVALHEGDSSAWTAWVQALLDHAARVFGLKLALRSGEQKRAAVCAELARQTAVADVGELAGPLAHEFNNFLNVLLLQVAALSQDASDEVRAELSRVRQQGLAASSLVRQWQRYRQHARLTACKVALNEVIRRTIEELTRGTNSPANVLPRPLVVAEEGQALPGPAPESVALRLKLAVVPPVVTGLPGDFKRLFVFLVRNAVAAVGEDAGTVTVETEMAAGRVLLRVADNGPSLPGEVLSTLFDPSNPGREGTNALELAACEALARRYLGKLRASERPAGGVVITLELPAAAGNSFPSNGSMVQAS